MRTRTAEDPFGGLPGRYDFRGDKTVAYESDLEADLLSVMEFLDVVSDVVERPFEIPYRDGRGRRRLYVPDFLIWYRPFGFGLRHVWEERRDVPDPMPLLVEVESRETLRERWGTLRPMFRAAVRYAARNDMIFRILDEGRVRNVLFKNVSVVRRYLRFEYSEFEEERMLGWVAALGHCSIDVLLTTLGYTTFRERAEGLGHVYNLIARKKLACLMSEPLGVKSVVWLSEGEAAKMGLP